MAEIVNLNRARKANRRETAVKTASENRIKFGRTSARKAADQAAAAARLRTLDQARREP
jgi:hypothetical protein